MKADGITIAQFNESAAGRLIFHIHFHVRPRFVGVELKRHSEKPADPNLIARHAEAILSALGRSSDNALSTSI
jgi:histidine triad (HIT) family protein